MNEVVFFFSEWTALGRTLVVGTAMYVVLVVFLRISGSRTLASMNAFDFIVTVAIGSAFGRALTAKGVALADATVAFALLVTLQYIITSLKTRWGYFTTVVTNPPALLYYKGEFMVGVMRRERVTKVEVETAVRKKQFGSMNEVEAVVLESSGGFSVIQNVGDGSALGDVIGEQIIHLGIDEASGEKT